MEQNSDIQLSYSCIMNVPLQTYNNDFTFIVNGKEFQTSRIISDLLSPKICKIHMIDPTIDTFCIKTSQQGHFSYILDLVSFTKKSIPTTELPFISEVIEILENETISLGQSEHQQELTEDNIFTEIKKHEKFRKFYSNFYQNEIEYLSSHFYDLCENKSQELAELQQDTLFNIITNENLLLDDEDQLLKFINKIYSENINFATLYETVYFERVSSEIISEFVDLFNINDVTNAAWIRLSNRLKQEIKGIDFVEGSRYNKKGVEFAFTGNNEFNGIINHLRTKSGGKIDNEIEIKASSNNNPNDSDVRGITMFDQKKSFWTKNEQISWICVDFKKYKIKPTHYTIRSCQFANYPKSWVIEVSNDKNKWDVIDEQTDCSYLNGSYNVHTFKINNPNRCNVKYIRIRQIQNCRNTYHLGIGSLEFYGTIFE